MYSSGMKIKLYDISKATNPSVKEKSDEKNLWTVVKFKLLASRQNLRFLKKENHGSWIRVIPLITEDIINSYKAPPVICVKHWPVGFEKIKSPKGRERPRDSPNIFEGVKKVWSQVLHLLVEPQNVLWTMLEHI